MSTIEYGTERHCLRVPGGAAMAAGEGSIDLEARGKAFDVTIRAYADGQTLAAAAGALGEEVAAVLEGSFRIDAAGETYTLSRGEAIVIPSGEPRLWCCTSARGVLYRVVVREPVVEDDAAAA